MIEFLKKAIMSHSRTNGLILLLFFLPLVTVIIGKKMGLFYQVATKVSATGTEKSKVTLVKWSGGSLTDAQIEQMVQDGLDSALGSGGFNSLVTGKRIVIKVNLGNECDRQEVSGGPVVKAVVNALKTANASTITIGEGRDTFGNGAENCAGAGYGGLAGVQYINFLSAPTRVVNVQNGLWPSSENLIIPQVYLNADVIISVPKMKTHNRTGITVGLKNVFGVPPISAYETVDGTAYGYREKLHRLITSRSITHINMAKPPDLVVTDGIFAGEGSGPWNTSEVVMNTVIVSADPVAADAVATSIMGFNPENIRHLVYSSFKGLGNFETDYIDVLGSTINSVRRNFQPAPSNPNQYSRKVTAIGDLPSGYSQDGNVGEWFAVKRPMKITGGGGEAQIWTAWNVNKLYIAAQVSDNQLNAQDGLTVYFSHDDPNGRQENAHLTYQSDDFKMVLPYDNFCNSSCAAVKRNISGGYTIEVEIPFAQLGGFPGLNEEIGFDIGFKDNGALTVWGGDLGVESNPSKMGVALLTNGLGPPPFSGQTPTATVTPAGPTQTPIVTITPTLTPVPPSPTSVLPTPTTTPVVSPTAIPTQIPACSCQTGIQKNLGNANCDDNIDGLDFEIWREEMTGLRTTTRANFDCVSGVNQADFDIWRQNRSK